MAYHHTAFATRDLQATHKFYTEAMGFELVKVVCGPSPEGGWARHVFYETGDGEYIAFWELHDVPAPASWSPAISTGQGLPMWVNHLAFKASDLDDIVRRRERLRASGYPVSEIDHGWCTSIYVADPNGIMVEFCTSTQEFTGADRDEALRLLTAPQPELEEPKRVEFFPAK